MAIRAWSSRRILRLWLIGIGLQLLIVVGLFAFSRLTAPPEPPIFSAMRAHDDSIRRGIVSPPRQSTSDQRAALVRTLRDSLGITVRHAGDTVVIDGPPELHRAGMAVAQGFGEAARAAVLMAALLFLPIPTALLLITIYWLLARRSRSLESVQPAA